MPATELNVSPLVGLPNDHHHNLIVVNEDVFIHWNDSQKTLEACQLDTKNQVIKRKVITLTEKPTFAVTTLSLSWKADGLALIGPHGLAFVDLPLNWDRIFHGDQQSSKPANCTQLGKQLFLGRSVTNLQTRWHPSSDSHLIVLASDNCLYVFDILDSCDEKRRIPILKDSENCGRLGISNAVGEGVVSFDFGPPLIKTINCEDVPELANIFPVFCLTGDGDIHMLYFSLAEEHVSNRVFGPLPIKPTCDDDYGFDACSIMCVDHQATFLVVATLSGRIYHFLALEDEVDLSKTDVLSVGPKEYEFYTLNRTRVCVPPLTLYLTDAIRIDFSVFVPRPSDPTKPQTSESGKNRFLGVFPHLFDPRRYYILHSFGLHSVYIKFIEQFLDDPNAKAVPVCNDQGSLVECLLSTNLREDNNLFPVGYAASMRNGLNVSVMFNNGKVIFKNSTLLQSMAKLGLSPDKNKTPTKITDGGDTPKKPFIERNTVADQFKQLLHRTSNIPAFVAEDANNNSELTQADVVALKNVIEIFKSEYFGKFLLGKSYLETVWRQHSTSYEQLLNRFEGLEKRMQTVISQLPHLVQKSEGILAKKSELNARTLKLYNTAIQRSPSIMKQDDKLAKELNEYSNKAAKYSADLQSLKDNFESLKKEKLKSKLKPMKPSQVDFEKICTLLNKQEKEILELGNHFEY